ncbi:hypothetical protein K438DRAFT_1992947 [Mycena galopus ATCC 62051]|nr:hypothetical protein K438DRAFT_1992947 [Mycena galopus ATCC 62051]
MSDASASVGMRQEVDNGGGAREQRVPITFTVCVFNVPWRRPLAAMAIDLVHIERQRRRQNTINPSSQERLDAKKLPSALTRSSISHRVPSSWSDIAVRTSSDLLLTSVVSPTLFTLGPTTINGTLETVHTFPNATSLTGLTEYLPGVFAVAASTINLTTFESAPGSTVIWSVDFNGHTPVVRELARLPSNASANGITSIPALPNAILVAGSNVGAIWQLDVRTGDTRLVIQDASMLPNEAPPALGINGLHSDRTSSFLYFSNSAQQTFSRLAFRIEEGDVIPVGAVQILANIQSTGEQQEPDDIALDADGRAWVAVHPGALVLLSPPKNVDGNWTQVTAVGNAEGTDAELLQPTSAAFGMGERPDILYVTTGVGQVVAVDTSVDTSEQ